MAILALSLLAGLLTIFNPCVLPLAPVLLAGANARDVRGPIALAAGLALTFGVVGGTLVALGLELGESALIRAPAGLLLIPIGVVLVWQRASDWASRAFAPLVRIGESLTARLPGASLWGQAGIGGLLALIWAPCIGPTMGAALVMAASSATRPMAIVAMMLFAIGAAASLLIAGFGLRRLMRGGRARAFQSARWAKTAFGIVLIIAGIAAATGWDHLVEGALAEAMPDWLIRFATRF